MEINNAKSTFVVLNYNDSDRTISLCKLAYQTRQFSSFIVVNNKGQASELEKLVAFRDSQEIPQFILISSETNGGFCAGCNIGLKYAAKQADASTTFLVNSDVSFTAECVDQCVDILAKNPRLAAAAPLMKNPDGSLDYNWGILPTFQDGLNSIFFFGERRFRKKQYGNAQSIFASPFTEVPWIRTSFIAFRTEALQKCRLFDERFFLYCGEYSLFTHFAEKGYGGAITNACSYVHNHISDASFKALRKRKIGSVKSMYLYLSSYRKINGFQKIIFRLAAPLAVFEYDLLY